MPTTCRVFDAADQAAEAERVRSLPVPLTVWECDTPAGGFRLRRLGAAYALDGDGLRLMGADPCFGEIGITAVDDADAVSSAKTLIFARWAAERDRMREEFWPAPAAAEDRGPGEYDQSGDPPRRDPAGAVDMLRGIAARNEAAGTLRRDDAEPWRVAEAGPLPAVDSDDDLTADLDEPRGDSPAEAAALA